MGNLAPKLGTMFDKASGGVLSDVIEHLHQGLSYFGRDLNLICCNRKYLELLEFPEWMGKPGTPAETFLRYNAERGEYGDGDVDGLVAERLEQIRRFEPHCFERERPDGIILRIEGTPIEKGGFVTTYMDVTELRRSEQALQRANEELDDRVRQRTTELMERESELREKTEMLETVLQSVTNGVSMFDRDLKVKLMNAKVHSMFDLPDWLGGPDASFEDIARFNAQRGEYGAVDVEEQVTWMMERARRFEPHHDIRQRPDGRLIEIHGEPVAGGFVSTYTDVTEQKRAEQDLREANAELENRVAARTEELLEAKERAEDANRAKSEFLAQMSHELRTPLNSIIGYSDIVLQGLFGPVGNDRYLDYITAVHHSGTHLLDLINDILEVVQMESGKVTLEEDRISLKAAVDAAVLVLRERADKKSHDLEIDVADNLPVLVADQRRIHQMLLNLLTNAIKFTPPKGRIGVSAGLGKDRRLSVTVTDNGPGIAQDDLDRILEPFTQSRAGMTAQEGTGLGLSIVEGLMREHGGELSIDSQLGKGTAMSLIFPAERTSN